MKKSYLMVAVAVSASAVAMAEDINREGHLRYLDNRLTLRPYLSMSYTYDSNVDSSKHSKSGSQWIVNPSLQATYLDDNWKVDAKI